MSREEMEVEEIELDEDSAVEDGVEAAILNLNKVLDLIGWLPADNETVYAINELVGNTVEVLQWIEDKLADTYFELDFELDERKLH